MRYRLELEYDGTRYRGWQSQPGQRTVQAELQSAAGRVAGKPPGDLQGAGRTDAGVHALAQVAHLDLDVRLTSDALRYRLNDALPADIVVTSAAPAARNFHARHDAIARRYLYQIARRPSAFGKKLVWWVKDPLDLSTMQQAARLFPGMRDMRAFCADPEAPNTRVEIRSLELAEAGQLILVRIEASHFLWKMVRQIVGVLAEVGRGRMQSSEVQSFLDHPSRRPAELTAPPSGLFLERVLYGTEPGGPLEPVLRVG
ncbi:MAG: tRNA pseudouridine synthase A [Candidatus Xenobia bacterium]